MKKEELKNSTSTKSKELLDKKNSVLIDDLKKKELCKKLKTKKRK